ncbi:MAG: protease inhibitor I42 family protein [Chloroflexota bacterium]|nr:protease inhibitor I42 family protein [Chloroflexota bacterium]
MKKLIKIFVFISLLLAALTACGAANEVNLDADDDGGQVELKSDQTMVISLEGNPTTGYTWEVAQVDEAVLKQVGEAEFEPDSDAVGSGGVQVLRFEAVNSGQTSLDLVYHRSWEDEEPVETFSVQVVVP